ncbi:hypothetical protein MMC07_000275 [Pseudocyphellaria aurata]|nr:hypothetical protein [Pseudocyphellaria aurata]
MSRLVAGIRNKTLLITLPGSPKGAKEILLAIIKLLPHACLQAAGGDSRALYVGGVSRSSRKTLQSICQRVLLDNEFIHPVSRVAQLNELSLLQDFEFNEDKIGSKKVESSRSKATPEKDRPRERRRSRPRVKKTKATSSQEGSTQCYDQQWCSEAVTQAAGETKFSPEGYADESDSETAAAERYCSFKQQITAFVIVESPSIPLYHGNNCWDDRRAPIINHPVLLLPTHFFSRNNGELARSSHDHGPPLRFFHAGGAAAASHLPHPTVPRHANGSSTLPIDSQNLTATAGSSHAADDIASKLHQMGRWADALLRDMRFQFSDLLRNFKMVWTPKKPTAFGDTFGI